MLVCQLFHSCPCSECKAIGKRKSVFVVVRRCLELACQILETLLSFNVLDSSAECLKSGIAARVVLLVPAVCTLFGFGVWVYSIWKETKPKPIPVSCANIYYPVSLLHALPSVKFADRASRTYSKQRSASRHIVHVHVHVMYMHMLWVLFIWSIKHTKIKQKNNVQPSVLRGKPEFRGVASLLAIGNIIYLPTIQSKNICNKHKQCAIAMWMSFLFYARQVQVHHTPNTHVLGVL